MIASLLYKFVNYKMPQSAQAAAQTAAAEHTRGSITICAHTPTFEFLKFEFKMFDLRLPIARKMNLFLVFEAGIRELEMAVTVQYAHICMHMAAAT